jgi:hypothetical protein
MSGELVPLADAILNAVLSSAEQDVRGLSTDLTRYLDTVCDLAPVQYARQEAGQEEGVAVLERTKPHPDDDALTLARQLGHGAMVDALRYASHMKEATQYGWTRGEETGTDKRGKPIYKWTGTPPDKGTKTQGIEPGSRGKAKGAPEAEGGDKPAPASEGEPALEKPPKPGKKEKPAKEVKKTAEELHAVLKGLNSADISDEEVVQLTKDLSKLSVAELQAMRKEMKISPEKDMKSATRGKLSGLLIDKAKEKGGKGEEKPPEPVTKEPPPAHLEEKQRQDMLKSALGDAFAGVDWSSPEALKASLAKALGVGEEKPALPAKVEPAPAPKLVEPSKPKAEAPKPVPTANKESAVLDTLHGLGKDDYHNLADFRDKLEEKTGPLSDQDFKKLMFKLSQDDKIRLVPSSDNSQLTDKDWKRGIKGDMEHFASVRLQPNLDEEPPEKPAPAPPAPEPKVGGEKPHPTDGMTPAQIKAELGRHRMADQAKTGSKMDINPWKLDPSAAPPHVLNAILKTVGEVKKKNSFDRPTMGRLYEAAKKVQPDLSLLDFQGAMMRLQLDRKVQLGAYGGNFSSMPDEIAKYSFPMDGDDKAYADDVDLRPYPESPRAEPAPEPKAGGEKTAKPPKKEPAPKEAKPVDPMEGHPLAGKSKEEMVKALNELNSRSGSVDPWGLEDLPSLKDESSVRYAVTEAIRQSMKEHNLYAPDFSQLYEAAKKASPGLTMKEFQGMVVRMRNDKQLRMVGWDNVPNRMPHPEAAFYLGRLQHNAKLGDEPLPENGEAGKFSRLARSARQRGDLASARIYERQARGE